MSNRFHTSEPLGLGDFLLEGPEAHHLAHVRRFEVGATVTLFNGDGREYSAEIVALEKRRVHLRILGIAEPAREFGFPFHIAAALPKGDRGDFLIEKLTELGVTDFTPLIAVRSVVQPKDDKVEKLQRAVIEASKQCGRNVLLRVHRPLRLEDWCRQESLPKRKWIAHPDGKKLEAMTDFTAGLAVAIGPEGGFTDTEVSTACHSGCDAISLGPRLLRVETAALAVTAWVSMNQ